MDSIDLRSTTKWCSGDSYCHSSAILSLAMCQRTVLRSQQLCYASRVMCQALPCTSLYQRCQMLPSVTLHRHLSTLDTLRYPQVLTTSESYAVLRQHGVAPRLLSYIVRRLSHGSGSGRHFVGTSSRGLGCIISL
jgi:hypothetical protein